MEHAILIIDMPESINGETPCKHCSLHIAEYDDYYHHYVCQSIRTNISADEWEIYKKCPLKPLVEAIPIEWIEEWFDQFYGEQGLEWNRCKRFMLSDWEKENETN